MSRKIAKHGARRPLKKRLEDVQRRVEDRASGMADKCLDIVEANLDHWLDNAATALLAKVGLVPPEKVSMKGKDGEVIVLQRQKDGSYA